MLRVEQGKGQKDRNGMLSPRLLELLREWWLHRPAHDVAVSGPRSAAADHDAPALSGRTDTAASGRDREAGVAAHVAAQLCHPSLEHGVDMRLIQVLSGTPSSRRARATRTSRPTCCATGPARSTGCATDAADGGAEVARRDSGSSSSGGRDISVTTAPLRVAPTAAT